MKVTIRVTQDDIDMAEATGGPNQPMVYKYCPDARACQRAFGCWVDVVEQWVLRPHSRHRIAAIPEEETQRIRNWDNGLGMEPHTFELETSDD